MTNPLPDLKVGDDYDVRKEGQIGDYLHHVDGLTFKIVDDGQEEKRATYVLLNVDGKCEKVYMGYSTLCIGKLRGIEKPVTTIYEHTRTIDGKPEVIWTRGRQ